MPRFLRRWRPPCPTVALAALCGAAIVLALLDLMLLYRFSLTRYLPVVEMGGVAIGIVEIFGDDRRNGSWLLISVVTGQFIAYGLALVTVRWVPDRAGRWVVYGAPVVFAALLLDLYPISTVDMFHYLASARTFWVHGDNPLTVPPMTYPFPVAMSYGDMPSPYGPLWTLLTLPAARLSEIDPAHVHIGLLGIKGIATISYLGSMWLVARIVGHLNPDRVLLAVVAFAWNPFIVYRVVGNGGNGLVMMGFVLLAVFFVVSGRWRWVGPALMAAVLVKYIPLLLVVPLVVYVLRLCRDRADWRRLVELLQGVEIASVGAAVIWIPFWDGWRTIAVVEEIEAMITSTP
ncbi:MAG: glycosyltransferase 87 family protein, partial [Dehalococcoidia bacterium]